MNIATWFQIPKDEDEERKRRADELCERLAKRRRTLEVIGNGGEGGNGGDE